MTRIAVVEDDPEQSALLRAVLVERGYEVTVFENGAEALLAIPRGGFDLVVSDVMMPQLDGISLCKALRGSFDTLQLPIVLISALDEEDDIRRGLEAGGNDYLTKPFAPPVLCAKIGIYLRQPAPLAPAAPTSEFRIEARPAVLPRPYGRYQLLELLGEGGSALVYRARETAAQGRDVALKLIDATIGGDTDGLARYFREVAILSLLDTPRVVKVLGSGFEAGKYYLAMELLEGESAEARLERTGPWPVRKALQVGVEVGEAMTVLAGRGLVHRDIKPSNIFLRDDDRTTLIDFGLAKDVQDQSLTAPQQFLGTIHYVAPEVISGAAADQKSDLYALGVSLYELLTGVHPFSAETSTAVLRLIMNAEEPPDARIVRPDLPEEIASLLTDLMACDPADRPSLVDAMSRMRLLHALGNEVS